jgi:hypothetical protein
MIGMRFFTVALLALIGLPQFAAAQAERDSQVARGGEWLSWRPDERSK